MTTPDSSLKTFYSTLETIESTDVWQIWQHYILGEETIETNRTAILLERKVFSYRLNNGELINPVKSLDIDGNPVKIEFSPEELDYIESRMCDTHNTWLKSRYSHILWLFRKHDKYAINVLDGYLSLIVDNKKGEHAHLDQYILALLRVSKTTKIRTEELADQIIDIYFNSTVYGKVKILKAILVYFSLFSKNELQKISQNISAYSIEKDSNYFLNKDFLNKGIYLFDKLNLNNQALYILLAENEDLILTHHMDDSDFLKLKIFGDKAKYYKLANELIEFDECLKEQNRLKQTVRLSSFKYEIEDDFLDLFNEYLQIKVRAILKLEPSQIWDYFSNSDNFLVEPDEVIKSAEKSVATSLENVFTRVEFDKNSNSKEYAENTTKREFSEKYSWLYTLKCESLFLNTLMTGVTQGKLNYYSLISFFENETWFVHRFNRKINSKESDEMSNWISMLAPGIYSFFSQFELSVILNDSKVNNYILSLDSLTLKFEGAMRDFIRLCGESTSIVKKGEIKEQVLEELIETASKKQYFTEADIELFKYTFTAKGKNMRNDVAHAFMLYSDYNFKNLSLVLLCVLRLGKYCLASTDLKR